MRRSKSKRFVIHMTIGVSVFLVFMFVPYMAGERLGYSYDSNEQGLVSTAIGLSTIVGLVAIPAFFFAWLLD